MTIEYYGFWQRDFSVGNQTPILGHGIYGISEAAHLLGISHQKAGAWFRGWSCKTGPILESDYAYSNTIRAISFLDLVDASVVMVLRDKHNVSPAKIRRMRQKLTNMWKTSHPFSRKELTDIWIDDDGKTVFVTDDQGQMIDILKGQFAMPPILLPFLHKVEYNLDSGYAHMIRLTDRVMLDPTRRYGKPIVDGTGMPTAILYRDYLANKDADAVADWYSVDPDDVLEAVKFETTFSGIAA